MKKLRIKILILPLLLTLSLSISATTMLAIDSHCRWGIAYANNRKDAIQIANDYCRINDCQKPKHIQFSENTPPGYAAIVAKRTKKGCQYGFALGKKNRKNAIQIAMKRCSPPWPNHTSDCKLIGIWYYTQ